MLIVLKKKAYEAFGPTYSLHIFNWKKVKGMNI
jgi:hypothetical protein